MEADLLDRDIDSLFDEPLPGSGETGEFAVKNGGGPGDRGDGGIKETGGPGNGSNGDAVLSTIRERRFTLDASYYFYGGVSPGWNEAPWYWNGEDEEYSTVLGAGMNAKLGLDFQISGHLRVKSLFTFVFPGLEFTVKEVFLDYNFLERVFFRGGKFTQDWGISPNYPYTNLLAQLPSNTTSDPGDTYIIKADIPVGIGGVELLSLTRPGFMANPSLPAFNEIGYGGKYNLAHRLADLDVGVFYHEKMPLRSFISVKSTLADTEVYAEALVSVRHKPWGTARGSGSIGFARDFFSEKLTIGGEYFYNGEKDAVYFNPETDLEEAEISPFIYGNNLAVSLLYRTGIWGDLRLMAQCLYSIDEKSAQFVPGLSWAPFPHIKASLGIPMALGSREGTYYRQNADKTNRPFSVVLLVSISGDYRLVYTP